jgi:hypothetical protein
MHIIVITIAKQFNNYFLSLVTCYEQVTSGGE